MKKEYMLKRLVTLFNRLGVQVSVNVFGVVRVHHPLIEGDCYYPSVTCCYDFMFGTSVIDSNKVGSVFYVLNSDGSTTPVMPT